jgi:protein required for attachment to host cells
MDGARAFIFTLSEGGSDLTLKESLINTHLTEHDPATDRRGREFESYSSVRHAYEPHTDWRTYQKHLFIQEISSFFKKIVDLHQLGGLILVAPSKLLGDLRKTLDREVSKKIFQEVEKDLTHLSEKEILDTLQVVLKPASFLNKG